MSDQETIFSSFGAKLRGDALHVRCTIENRRGRGVYLLNALWSFDDLGAYAAPPMAAYACLTTANVLHLRQGVVPPPRTKRVPSTVIPFATAVDAGATLEARMELPAPIEEHSPYYPRLPDTRWDPVRSASLRFTMSYVEHHEELLVRPAPGGDTVQVWHPRLLALIETLEATVPELEVPVRKRRDAFEDF